jgi:ABC-type Zn2+ transport system substrate-binding protein/surface adhesin
MSEIQKNYLTLFLLYKLKNFVIYHDAYSYFQSYFGLEPELIIAGETTTDAVPPDPMVTAVVTTKLRNTLPPYGWRFCGLTANTPAI